ncbi:hypothetical protein HHL17_00950 [Chitinophaga sp. G-6-1-13]|uniref:GLPGLI family protein n=1 Tax=Chitinophaga fulva TaxID=2728842 RepID=A0A848GDH0_9BACT|nr:DUF6134 family protein [Chitinophaga fulva]NML35751.1 hypothetical protein [Chitinophaga fulva]
MKCLFRVLLCVVTVAVFYHPVQAQTTTFEVRIANHAVGTIEAQRKVSGSAKSITIKTRIQTLLARINSDILNEYDNNVLTLAKSTRVAGKKGEDKETTTRRNGNDYTVMLNGARSVIDNTEIAHCVADLYFSEPKQVSRIFSEALGKFLPLHPLGSGQYELVLPEGKKNIYKYSNGVLTEVEVNHTFGRALFIKTI